MKNHKSGFLGVVIGIVIALVVIAVVGYVYIEHINNTKNNLIIPIGMATTTETTGSTTPVSTTVFSDQAIATAIDPSYTETNGVFGYVADHWHYSLPNIYRGDFNNDGYQDAIVLGLACDADCGTSINFVENEKDGTGKLLTNITFPSYFQFASAAATDITNITVQNGIIAITANNFCGSPSQGYCSDQLPPQTKYFKLEGGALVEVNSNTSSVISPWNILITNTSTSSPVISSVTPSIIDIGSSITITGSNFEPVGGWVGNGWIGNPHTFVQLTNSSGKVIVTIWSGNEPDETPNPITNSITLTVPSSACTATAGQVAGYGGCPPSDSVTLVPGSYTLTVSADGRGTSNTFPITISSST